MLAAEYEVVPLTRADLDITGDAGVRTAVLPGMAFDTHAAVKMATSAGAKEELAVAVVDIARQASAAHDHELATKADLANLKADLTWRLVAAMAAIGAIPRFVG